MNGFFDCSNTLFLLGVYTLHTNWVILKRLIYGSELPG